MAIFKLEIRLDNAAFHDDDGDFDPEPELREILEGVANDVCNVRGKNSIRDVNGNLVGDWRIEE